MKMNKLLISSFCLGLIVLSTGTYAVVKADREGTIAYPVASLIAETVFAMTPTVNNVRNDVMTKLVCDLARKEKTQDEVNAFLKEKGIDNSKIPQSGHDLSLLVNRKLNDQQAACAAFIATSVMVPQNNRVFQVENKAKNGFDIDPAKMAETMRVRLSIAEANAEFFTLMASSLKTKKNAELLSYQRQVYEMFYSLAPFYLERVKQLYAEPSGPIELLSLAGSDYRVMDGRGRVLSFTQGGVDLDAYGVKWLGAGQLLGKSYSVDVQYFKGNAESPIKPVKK